MATVAKRAWLMSSIVVLAIAACGDPEEEAEPEVETIRLTIGGTTVNINSACQATPGSVSLPAAGAALAATFLKADGNVEPLVTSDEFELQVSPAARFTRSSAFAGTLTPAAEGGVQVSFVLFHKIEQHEDFGPCSLTVNRQ